MERQRTGYGDLTNIPKISDVHMVTIMMGVGTDESPIREVRYFYDKNYELIGHIDHYSTRLDK